MTDPRGQTRVKFEISWLWLSPHGLGWNSGKEVVGSAQRKSHEQSSAVLLWVVRGHHHCANEVKLAVITPSIL